MLRNRLYYRLKPFLPWPVRMGVRRAFALRKRRRVESIWPILPGSEKPPANWPGWPEGKQFAVVLTHDVEGQAGLDKIPKLMELEQRLGFRSSFNLIPEGKEYRVTAELRRRITENGFELGIHDLYHDGRLFLTEADFRRNAVKINQYIKDWGVAGFRSGFMLHNLDWIHDLDVQYDASTFDTDPFEPQPHGQGTIFPFWVARSGRATSEWRMANGVSDTRHQSPQKSDHSPFAIRHSPSSGYVELPYTLPQDSTLFLLLQERTNDIWLQKLDWVAKSGGMVMVNVHPDYLRFEGDAPSLRTYPCGFYSGMLEYLRKRYGEAFWQPTAGELVRRYRSDRPIAGNGSPPRDVAFSIPAIDPPVHRPLAGKRAVVLLYSYYSTDPRPRRETELLVKAGMEVDVFCLRTDPAKPLFEKIDGVNVFRMPMKRRRDSKLTYMLQYALFVLGASAFASSRSFVKRYHLVHVHNMPDVLVFSALLPKLLGAKVILDLHDPMPELFQGIYGLSVDHWLVRMLRVFERASTRFVDQVLTPNRAFQELFVSRSCGRDKIRIVMNTPQTRLFDPAKYAVSTRSSRSSSAFTIMYHGLLVERHGLDLAVRAVAQIRSRLPGIRLNFYGEPTPYMDEVMRLVEKLELQNVVHYHGFRSLPEIAEALSESDLGLIPNRLNPFTQINMPTRVFECLAMRKPVIAPRTLGITDYFGEDEMMFFNPGDENDLAARIEWAATHPNELQEIVAKGRKVYDQHRWEGEGKILEDLVQDLLGPKPNVPPRGLPTGSKRICMISYSNYETDNRVMRYAEELARRGDFVEVLSLKRDRKQSRLGMVSGVHVRRIQCRSRKNQKSKLAFLLPILRFWLASWAQLSWRHWRHRYDLIHVHNVPDFLVFAAWLPKWTGTKVILDIHDIVPEFYASKFGVLEDSFTTRMLLRMERASARFADHVIISNHLWRDKYAARTGSDRKCSVFINNVDSKVFVPCSRTRNDGKSIVIFPGGLQWHQGLDIALRAFQLARAEIPNAEFHIYGDGNIKEQLIDLAKDLGLNGSVRFFDPIPVHQLVQVVANADLGVVPKRADSFGNEAYSTKIMEFMSLGVPVVVSKTKIDQYYFDDSVVRFFEAGNPDAMAEGIVEVLRNRDLRERLVTNASAYAARNSWESRKAEYLALVDGLVNSKG